MTIYDDMSPQDEPAVPDFYSTKHPHDQEPILTPTGRCLICLGLTPALTITLPLTAEQAQAVVVVADAFGVEPWEMAVHLLAEIQRMHL